MMNVIFEFATSILLLGIFALACVMIVLAMCAVASDADEKTEEWLDGRKEKEDDRE